MKASSVNKINFVTSVISFSVILIFGILFLSLTLIFSKDVPENFIGSNAVIARIGKELSPTCDASDGIDAEDYEYSVFIDYSYNGKKYENIEYDRYDSSMNEGDTVLIYINPDDPTDFMSDPSGDYVFIIVGTVVAMIGIGGLGYTISKKEKRV